MSVIGDVKEMQETIRYMAENTHQAYHQDRQCGWWDCPRNVCNAAQQALPELVAKLKKYGKEPPLTHCLWEGKTLCGKPWMTLAAERIHDRWVGLNDPDREHLAKIDCPECRRQAALEPQPEG